MSKLKQPGNGIHNQRIIKERMGFHYGKTLFRIDTEIPVTSVTLLGPRVLFWIIPIISRRNSFIHDLEMNLVHSSLHKWSARTKARTINYESWVLREGVESWFHYMLCTAMAIHAKQTAIGPANMPVDEEATNLPFEFVNRFDDKRIQEEEPANMPLRKEAAIRNFGFVNRLDDTPI